MTSSPHSTTNQQHPQDAPLAASAHKVCAPERRGSPIDQSMDLLEPVEALGPRWPKRVVWACTDYRLKCGASARLQQLACA